MKAGKDIVKATTTEENAYWMMKNKPLSDEIIDGYPEFFVHAGEFYFKGIRQQKKRRKKGVVCE